MSKPRPPIHVSFDLGGKTGVCVHKCYETWPEGAYTATWDLVYGDIGGRRSPIPMLRFWRCLHRLEKKLDIKTITFEETFARGEAKFRLDSLQNATMLFAVTRGIDWMRVAVPAWKKQCLGDSRISKDDYTLKAVAQFPDIGIASDDEAAAVWLMHYRHFKREDA